MVRRILALVVAAGAFLAQPAARLSAQRPVVTKASELPVHSYHVTEAASKLIQDSVALGELARAVDRDLKSDLSGYDIQDPTTRRDYYGNLASIAMLQGDDSAALAYSDSGRALEAKPAARLMHGMLLRAEVAALHAPAGDRPSVFSSTLRTELDALPYDTVEAELKSTAGSMATLAPGVMIGFVQASYDSASMSGSISKDIAVTLVNAAVTLREVYPYRAQALAELNRVVDAHNTEKADIWAARDVSLDGRSGLAPVIVAISDVGTDVSLFPGRIWTNKKEIAGNGKDDDHDGYVDDVHGIAWSWTGQALTGALRPLTPYTAADMQTASTRIEGFNDLQAHLATPAARAVQARMASLAPAEVKPFIEQVEFYSNYAHGTHVAGIASNGNPAIRLQVDRLEFPYQMIPPAPTRAWADGFAAAMQRSVAYYKRTGVRVVNMSWGFSQNDLQQMLEANRAGGSDEERKTMAAAYFSTVADSFRNAMAAAPNVLFVSAAGNSDDNNAFTETVPASFDLPNTITVGAVDQAGDQAAFTSFGKVDVYADGYEVESVLPGGEKQKWSGTSMASPQVVNLAAKLLALHPRLTSAEVKRLIVDGADPREVGGRTIRLLNEKKSLELARGG